MIIRPVTVDIAAQIAQKHRPVVMVRRAEGENHAGFVAAKPVDGEWWLLQEPLPGNADTLNWSIDKTSSVVRVPLFSYETSQATGQQVLELGVTIGALAFRKLPADRVVESLLIAIGNVFNNPRPDKPGYQCWLGFALKLKT